MTAANKAIDSHVDVVLHTVTGLNDGTFMHVTDSAEFLKLIERLEDEEFILAKCPNYFGAKPDAQEITTRYLLFIAGFGRLFWVYDIKTKGSSK